MNEETYKKASELKQQKIFANLQLRDLRELRKKAANPPKDLFVKEAVEQLYHSDNWTTVELHNDLFDKLYDVVIQGIDNRIAYVEDDMNAIQQEFDNLKD